MAPDAVLHNVLHGSLSRVFGSIDRYVHQEREQGVCHSAANPKDFRNEVVKFSLRARAGNHGRNPSWTSYEKIREVIERRMFSQVEELLPVISFGSKKDSETEKKHGEFVQRMMERGYTERQVRRLVEWYMRVKQAG